VEANILVAEALLECPEDKDVVMTETDAVLVTAAERVDYARGYYDKARDELQETVYLMARIAESNQNLGTEKEDVCFLATLLMGVGTTLAEYDKRLASAAALNELQSKEIINDYRMHHQSPALLFCAQIHYTFWHCLPLLVSVIIAH
jgi:hypothetical protein